jgi:uncharacterized protein YwgA
MKRLQKVVLLTVLAEKLLEKGSWCGETHLQKATYFLQELINVPTEFDFIFYKHGPFSFDLRDELTAMWADGLLELQLRHPDYGPSFVPTERCKKLQNLFPHTLNKYKKELEFVAETLGDKGVTELEQVATGLYVTLEQPDKDLMERANRIHELKPHVSVEEGKFSIANVETIIREAAADFDIPANLSQLVAAANI